MNYRITATLHAPAGLSWYQFYHAITNPDSLTDYWEIGLSLIGAIPAESLSELRKQDEYREPHQFYRMASIFGIGTAKSWDLTPADNCIEAWVWTASAQSCVRTHPEHSDFWRTTRDGKLYSIRGYMEDGSLSCWIPGPGVLRYHPNLALGRGIAICYPPC